MMIKTSGTQLDFVLKSKYIITRFALLLSTLLLLTACNSTPIQENSDIPPPPVIEKSVAVVANDTAERAIKHKNTESTKNKTPVTKPTIKITKQKTKKKPDKTSIKTKPTKTITKKVSKIKTTKPIKKKAKIITIVKKTPATTSKLKTQAVTINKPETPEERKPTAPTVTQSEDIAQQLPLTFGELWTLSKNEDNNCVLSYKKLLIEDGQGTGPLNLSLFDDKILIQTKSNIDTSYPQSGLTIDDLPQHAIEVLYNDYSIKYAENYRSIIEQMKSGKQASVALGFWPTWPITQTYSVNFDLSDFPAAHNAFITCLNNE